MLLLRLALDLRPDFTAARLLAADILESRHHLENALQMLARGRDDDPLISVVRLQRAALTERLGHTDEAMHDLQRIARDYPDSPLPADARGRHAARQAALRRSDRRLRPRHSADQGAGARTTGSLFYDRGICYERSRQWAKAEADFKRALELAPDQPFVLNYLGYSWADMGQNLAAGAGR